MSIYRHYKLATLQRIRGAVTGVSGWFRCSRLATLECTAQSSSNSNIYYDFCPKDNGLLRLKTRVVGVRGKGARLPFTVFG